METKLYNKIEKLFPELLNIKTIQQTLVADPDIHQDGNGNALPSEKINGKTDTLNLFSQLSKNWIDAIALEEGVIDDDTITVTEHINMSVGNPVINVEVCSGALSKIDGHDFNGSGINNSIAQVRLHRHHCDFTLYDTDIMYGYGLENKMQSAISSILRGVRHEFLKEISGLNGTCEVSAASSAITPATIATLSGSYSSPDKLYVKSQAYAKLIANSLGKIDPTQPGALGWNKIIRVVDNFSDLGSWDAIGTLAGNVIGAAGYQSFDSIAAYAGNSVAVRDLGTIHKIPFVAIFSFDPTKMAIRCSVQAWVGFTVGSWRTAYGLKDNNTDASVKVEVVNTTAKPVNTKEVTA